MRARTSDDADKLLLASSSQARKHLLASAGVSFLVRPIALDEDVLKKRLIGYGAGPKRIAIELAEAKAIAASAKNSRVLVLAADQTLDISGVVLSKPETFEDALTQLERLSGRWHQLHSAYAFARGGRVLCRGVRSAFLKMRHFRKPELTKYLATADPDVLGSVGAYKIEGSGMGLFETIIGDQSTIMGLPMVPVLSTLSSAAALNFEASA